MSRATQTHRHRTADHTIRVRNSTRLHGSCLPHRNGSCGSTTGCSSCSGLPCTCARPLHACSCTLLVTSDTLPRCRKGNSPYPSNGSPNRSCWTDECDKYSPLLLFFVFSVKEECVAPATRMSGFATSQYVSVGFDKHFFVFV